MVLHRQQAQFDRARWRLVMLGPFWLLQSLLTLTTIGLFAWRLHFTITHYAEDEDKGQIPTVEIV